MNKKGVIGKELFPRWKKYLNSLKRLIFQRSRNMNFYYFNWTAKTGKRGQELCGFIFMLKIMFFVFVTQFNCVWSIFERIVTKINGAIMPDYNFYLTLCHYITSENHYYLDKWFLILFDANNFYSTIFQCLHFRKSPLLRQMITFIWLILHLILKVEIWI